MQLRVATVATYRYARVLEKLPQQPGDAVVLMFIGPCIIAIVDE